MVVLEVPCEAPPDVARTLTTRGTAAPLENHVSEIYEITTRASTIYVEAESGTKAVAYARRGITARKLSGSEVRCLPAETSILDASTERLVILGRGEEFDHGDHPDRPD